MKKNSKEYLNEKYGYKSTTEIYNKIKIEKLIKKEILIGVFSVIFSLLLVGVWVLLWVLYFLLPDLIYIIVSCSILIFIAISIMNIFNEEW